MKKVNLDQEVFLQVKQRNPDGIAIAVRPNVFTDPVAWGMILVDIAQHVASGLEKIDNTPAQETLARIKEGFEKEWARPTGNPHGGVVVESTDDEPKPTN